MRAAALQGLGEGVLLFGRAVFFTHSPLPSLADAQVQEDRGLPNLQQAEERVPGLSGLVDKTAPCVFWEVFDHK